MAAHTGIAYMGERRLVGVALQRAVQALGEVHDGAAGLNEDAAQA